MYHLRNIYIRPYGTVTIHSPVLIIKKINELYGRYLRWTEEETLVVTRMFTSILFNLK